MSATATAQWTFQATHAASSEACQVAETWVRAAGLEEIAALRLVLILEELFTNTMKYGYGETSQGPVRISLNCQNGEVELVYADQAPPFDPTAPTEIGAPNINTGREGGVGLRLINVVGSDVTYRRDNGWNELKLRIGSDRLV